jgi:hypothetical protein
MVSSEMPRSLVSQAGPLAMMRVLAVDATCLKRCVTIVSSEVIELLRLIR